MCYNIRILMIFVHSSDEEAHKVHFNRLSATVTLYGWIQGGLWGLETPSKLCYSKTSASNNHSNKSYNLFSLKRQNRLDYVWGFT